MSDFETQQLDRSYLDQETRDAATRYLVRSGNGDVLVALGLAVEREPDAEVELCSACGRPVPKSGVCRVGRQCRIDAEGGAR
jgi:hypothetical protein